MNTAVRPTTPIARRRDPATSHQAAREVTRSGERNRQIDAVLATLRWWRRGYWPTSAELAQAMEVSRYIPARRLPELRRAGKVRNDTIRRCTVTGKSAMTWAPVTLRASQERLF